MQNGEADRIGGYLLNVIAIQFQARYLETNWSFSFEIYKLLVYNDNP